MRARTGGLPAILGIGFLAVFGTIATAQQPSSTRITSTGQPQSTTSTRLVNATVVSVDGNNVVAEDASGHATQYTIPDGFKFQFEGRDIGVAELKPGMHVSATVTTTTTTTPVYVTEIKTGKVLVVSGHSIIVRGPQGNRVFSNKDAEQRDVTVMRNGQKVYLSDLRAGDNFTAVIVSDEAPRVVTEKEVQAMAHAAPAPASAPAPTEAAAAAPVAAPTEAAAAAPASVPTETSASAPAATPAEAPAMASSTATAPAPETAETPRRFPTWLLIVLVVVILLVVFLRRRRREALTEASWNRRAAGLRGRRLRPPQTREGSRLRWP